MSSVETDIPYDAHLNLVIQVCSTSFEVLQPLLGILQRVSEGIVTNYAFFLCQTGNNQLQCEKGRVEHAHPRSFLWTEIISALPVGLIV